jgi:hypothetical protein
MTSHKSDPRRAANATRAKVNGQADHHDGTGVTPATVAYAVRLSCVVRGCTCSPDVTVRRPADGITSVAIAHDDGCPALEEGAA